MKLVHSSILNIELTNNNAGQGHKWFSSAKVRKQIEAQLKVEGHTRKPFDCLVTVHYTRILGKGQRLWDASSVLRGNAKQLEDALVSLGWFTDDSPKYIKHVAGFQDDTQRDNGKKTLIEVFTTNKTK